MYSESCPDNFTVDSTYTTYSELDGIVVFCIHYIVCLRFTVPENLDKINSEIISSFYQKSSCKSLLLLMSLFFFFSK